MTRGKVVAIAAISLFCGMFLLWITWQMAFMHGQIIRGIEFLSWQKDFQSAMDAKIPYEWGQYRFVPHTNTNEVRVTKIKGLGKGHKKVIAEITTAGSNTN